MADPRQPPPERLMQIAQRKLQQLGIPCAPTPDGRALQGELPLRSARLLGQGTEAGPTRARFVVEGHDRLRFLDAPLSALAPVAFYALEQVAQVEDAVERAVRERVAGLTPAGAQLQRLGLRPQLDGAALALRASVETTGNTFELLASPGAVRVARVVPRGGAPFLVAEDAGELQLTEHATRADLELHLEDRVAALRASAVRARPAPAPGPGPAVRVEPLPPGARALTLGQLVERFGRDAQLSPAATVEVWQDLQAQGARYRFIATREAGHSFAGRLLGPSGEVWNERFELTHFAGPAALLEQQLSQAGAPGAVAVGVEEPAPPDTPEHLRPHAGEHWVMNIVIEREDAAEVRYVCTNVDGQHYGASRVLARRDFEAAFVRGLGGSCRLLILVEQVEPGAVVYRQCDAARVPRGQPRRLSTGVLVSTFVPEAAAY